MATTRVWNISDDPSTKVPAIHIVVLGKDLAPGQFVQVDDSQLVGSHKIKKDVERKWLWVGMELPASYRAFKKPQSAAVPPAGAVRAHGEVKAVGEAGAAVVEEKLAESTEETGGRRKKKW
jgi:hypothetical protein